MAEILEATPLLNNATADESSKTPHFITNVKLRCGKQGLWLT
jgi:hypothetical protein